MQRSRSWVWLQVLIAWLPVWVLYAILIATAHPQVGKGSAALSAFWAISVAAALGLLVQRLTEQIQWGYPLRARFVVIHVVASIAYAGTWVALTFMVELFVHGHMGMPYQHPPPAFMVMGVWLYIIVAGASYAIQATERASQAEALAAQSQLAALRAQLNPHFLFNALHTVVQLIPLDPKLAAIAAEQLAGLLRTGLEEDRDLVPLSEEIAFVERYVTLERIRFGDRLDVLIDIKADARDALVPSFALQSLVENAVRHGAEPREQPTSILVDGTRDGDIVRLTVRDSGAGAPPEEIDREAGTGLPRLRERLAALYGGTARLDVSSSAIGFTATIVLPYEQAD